VRPDEIELFFHFQQQNNLNIQQFFDAFLKEQAL